MFVKFWQRLKERKNIVSRFKELTKKRILDMMKMLAAIIFYQRVLNFTKGGEITMFRRLKNQKGFTLVELLIVIVILGILAAIVIARFAGATKETKEASLKGNLRTMRSSLEIYKANSKSNSYPEVLDDLWKGTNPDVDSKTFLERIPLDPFHKKRSYTVVSETFDPIDSAAERDTKINGGGGWAYDSIGGRICANYLSSDTTVGDPIDTSWGTEYNLW